MNPTVQPVFWVRHYHSGASARCCKSMVWVLMKSGNHTASHPFFCNCPQFSYPNLLRRPQGFLLNNSQVEGTRKDENQHRSRRGSWKREQSWVLHHLTEKKSGAPVRESLWGGSYHSEPSCTKGSLCRLHSWRAVDVQTLIWVLGAWRDTCYWEGFFKGVWLPAVEMSACQLKAVCCQVNQGQMDIPRVGWPWKAGIEKRVDDLCLRSADSSLCSRVQNEDLGIKGREEQTSCRNPTEAPFSRDLHPWVLKHFRAWRLFMDLFDQRPKLTRRKW